MCGAWSLYCQYLPLQQRPFSLQFGVQQDTCAAERDALIAEHTASCLVSLLLLCLQELDLGRGYATANPTVDEIVLHAGVYAAVAQLTQLTSLDLSRRRMVDRQEVEDRKKQRKKGKYPAELRSMMDSLKRLRFINLGSTAIEPDAIKRLVRHFPAVNIDGRKSMAESTPDLANYGLAGTLCVL